GDTLRETDANFGLHGMVPRGKRATGQTTKVGSYPPNAWGIYDLHGNVCEWCEDRRVYPTAANVVTRSMRGGSWRYSAASCGSATCDAAAPSARNNFVGFRVCLDEALVSFQG